MTLPADNGYASLLEKARSSHEQGRTSREIDDSDIALARLYSYAFRIHTIGAFHATRLAVESQSPADPLAVAQLRRASETLRDLADQGMETVPDDFRAVISTFYRYDRSVRRVINALEGAHRATISDGIDGIDGITERFRATMADITSNNGIHLTRDTESPIQASFVVPNLGITIVPLVYGDHHSWNMAFLNEEHLDVPWHRHHHGVEIHLGYAPLEGYMILGEWRSPVKEGYALPIPPMTRHGWANLSGEVHHVPFIFGSFKQAGWGVFLDVEPQPMLLENFTEVDRDGWQMGSAVFLEREIATVAALRSARRQVIVPAPVTNRDGSGGLELAVTRATEAPFDLPRDDFRAVSVVRGEGLVRVGPVERAVRTHDHFAIPARMAASIRQTGTEPLVLLDTLIKPLA